jgi:putative nucleotidyltransferase with HDIG domain
MPMPRVATKERGSRSPGRRTRAAASNGKPKAGKANRTKVAKPKRSKPKQGKLKAADRGAGHGGQRLAAAFDAVSDLPALAESRRRLMSASDAATVSSDELAAAIESDTALAIQVMRAANNGGGPHGRTGGIRQAVDVLTAPRIREIVEGVDTYDPFEAPNALSACHERFRRHAVATRHAADRIADLARLPDRDELAVAALLHDIGRLVLAELHSGFADTGDSSATPDERIRHERRELGIDHALVGAVLVRRWALSPKVAAAIKRHHSPKASGQAAAIRLADLVVHYASGDPAPPETIVEAAGQLGIEREQVIPLLYEFPHSGVGVKRSSDPCPLSVREVDALRGLADGKVYKQIAHELSLSVSTVRTHLHNVYRKTGAVDRAQAVLIAHEHGWL